MARDAELRARITAKDDASKVIDKIADAAADLEKPVEVEVDADVAGALSELDRLTTEAHATAVAAEELGRALGPELAAKADLTAVVGELNKLGVTTEQVTANADAMAVKLKEAADADVGGPLGSSLGTARGKLDEMSDAANKGRNSLANMLGNVSQDLGAFGGIAGSAGVGLGQLAEGAADAALGGEKLSSALGQTAMMAAPIAALGLAMQVLQGAMEAGAASRAFDAANVKQYSEAIKEGESATKSFNDEIRETGELQFRAKSGGGMLGMFSTTEDLLPVLEEANLKVADFNKIVAEYVEAGGGSADMNDKWRASLEAQGVSMLDAIKIVQAANQESDARIEATEKGIRVTDQLAGSTEGATRNLSAFVQLGLEAGTDAMQQWAEEAARAAEGAQAFNDASAGIDFKTADAMGGLTAMGLFNDMLFAQANMLQKDEEAFAALDKSVEENGKTFDVHTEKGRANQDALEGVARALEDDLAVAYRDADGDQAAFMTSATKLGEQTLTRLQKELGLSDKETEDLGKTLGLTAGDYEARFKLSGDEEAKIKLGLLQGAIDALDKDVQAKVTQQIIMGDYQGALNTIQEHYNANHVKAWADVSKGTGWDLFNNKSIEASVNVSKGSGWSIFDNPFGRSVAAPAGLGVNATGTTQMAIDVVVPSAAEIRRKIGRITIPFAVASGLRADQRLSGARAL